LNTKVAHQLTPYQTYKSSRVVWSTDRAQLARELDRKLGACEQWSSTKICIFHHLTLQTSNVTQQRNCVPWQTAPFSHWVILKCLVKFWRTCQSSRMTQRGQRGKVLGKGLTMGWLGFPRVVRGVVKRVISTNHHWAKTWGVTIWQCSHFWAVAITSFLMWWRTFRHPRGVVA
jgi:hypothetical protein